MTSKVTSKVKSKVKRLPISKAQLAVVLVLTVGLYALLPQLSGFKASWHLVGQANVRYLELAFISVCLSYVAAATSYCLLAWRPLGTLRVIGVQLAAMFVNRLLPAGIGGLGANYRFLRQQRHTPSQAAVTVAVNNLLGVLGHGLLILIALLLAGAQPVAGLPRWHASPGGAVVVIVGLITVFGYAISRSRRLQAGLLGLKKQLLQYRQRPVDLLMALAASMVLTLANLACLAYCLQAVHIHLDFLPLILVFSFGIGLGTAVPTPGGLGGVEAGLVAGLVAYHVHQPNALAAALLYRLISYWLMLAIGGVAFSYALRQGYFAPRS